MKKLDNSSNTIILSDFDGTITTFDTNAGLFSRHGEKTFVEKIGRQYYNREIDLKTLFNLYFGEVRLSKEKYLDYILNEVKLQEGFDKFYQNLKKHNIPLAIISGGFETGIKPFLKKHGFENIPIHANRLIFDNDNISVDFYDEKYFSHLIDKDHYIDFKVEIIKNYRKKYEKIIFIGDGSTDINVVGKVDYLFAKDYLEKYCIENHIEYIGWEDFNDIDEWLFD